MIYVVIGKQDVVCYACADKLFNITQTRKEKMPKSTKQKGHLSLKMTILFNFKGILLLHPLKNSFFLAL